MHPCLHPIIYPSLYPSIHPSLHLFMNPSIHRSMHPCTRPSVRPSVRPCIHPSIHPSIHPTFRAEGRSEESELMSLGTAKLHRRYDRQGKGCSRGMGGSVVEFSPATREARVRFPAHAESSPFWYSCPRCLGTAHHAHHTSWTHMV